MLHDYFFFIGFNFVYNYQEIQYAKSFAIILPDPINNLAELICKLCKHYPNYAFCKKVDMKKIFLSGLVAGIILSIVSYGGLYLSVRFLPNLFIDAYANNPLINSDGIKDVLFFSHAFVLCFALSWFWERFKGFLKGTSFLRSLKFGGIYAFIGLLPVMWITYSAMDVTVTMVFSWLLYGFFQAIIAGIVFVKMNP